MEGEVAIGVSFASEVRLIVSWEVHPTEGKAAYPLIAHTEALMPKSPWPLWVSDGWDPYGEALYRRHAVRVTFARTGRPGRPKEPKLLPHPSLRYVQAVKVRNRYHRVIGVQPRVIFGQARRSEITTWCLERQNLNFRHENRRLARKTLAFSKSVRGLKDQLAFYQVYFDVIRFHLGLRVPLNGSGLKRWRHRTPAMAAGLSDHPWTMTEFLSYKVSLN